jgi:hypothetical protein
MQQLLLGRAALRFLLLPLPLMPQQLLLIMLLLHLVTLFQLCMLPAELRQLGLTLLLPRFTFFLFQL